MTTQVTKTSSKIVKSITAAVLFVACTSSIFASDINSEIADLGKTAIADIRSDFIAKASADRVNLLSYADTATRTVNSSNFAKLGQAAVDTINQDFVAASSSLASDNLSAALNAAPYQKEDRMVVYASQNIETDNQVSQTTLLPSVDAYMEFDFSETFDRIVKETFSVALTSSVTTTNEIFRYFE